MTLIDATHSQNDDCLRRCVYWECQILRNRLRLKRERTFADMGRLNIDAS